MYAPQGALRCSSSVLASSVIVIATVPGLLPTLGIPALGFRLHISELLSDGLSGRCGTHQAVSHRQPEAQNRHLGAFAGILRSPVLRRHQCRRNGGQAAQPRLYAAVLCGDAGSIPVCGLPLHFHSGQTVFESSLPRRAAPDTASQALSTVSPVQKKSRQASRMAFALYGVPCSASLRTCSLAASTSTPRLYNLAADIRRSSFRASMPPPHKDEF